jgi:YcaO-like protein with predicted kinase domain
VTSPESLTSSEQLFAQLRRHFVPAGITRVADVTGLDVVGIPVTMVTRPLGFALSVAQGKGVTLADARLSGVMEALEHHHAEEPPIALRYGSAERLLKDAPVLGGQLAVRPGLWAEARSLTDASVAFVPYELVHLDHRTPSPSQSTPLESSSVGLGGARTREGAASHALLEIIERDEARAFYALEAQTQRRRRVDLGSVEDPTCRALLARYAAADVRVGLWDIRQRFGVPCYLCDVIDAHPNPFRPMIRARGYGAASSHALALRRALCEAAQSRLTVVAGARDDLDDEAIERARQPEAIARATAQLEGNGAVRVPGDDPGEPFVDAASELSWVVHRYLAAGLPAPYVVDLSRPGWPVAFVRVVAPGLLTELGAGGGRHG